MDQRRPVIRSIADAELMHAQILDSAARTAAWLRSFDAEPMTFLRKLRFETVGHDPLTGQPLNVVEQLNQTFTILVSLRAVETLSSFIRRQVVSSWHSALRAGGTSRVSRRTSLQRRCSPQPIRGAIRSCARISRG